VRYCSDGALLYPFSQAVNRDAVASDLDDGEDWCVYLLGLTFLNEARFGSEE
jgi:hypothetical protein